MRRTCEPDTRALMRNMEPGEAQQTEAAPGPLFASIEANGGPGWPGGSHWTALRHHGATMAVLADPEGLNAACDWLCASTLAQHAEVRRALLAAAWAGLDGATP